MIFPHPSWYWDTLLKICVFIFAFIMPVLIITVCYGLMILRLKSVRMLSGSQVNEEYVFILSQAQAEIGAFSE